MPKPEQFEYRDYENAYLDMIREVKILTEEPEIQCLIKQYDNVAWEIRSFCTASIGALLNLDNGQLSESQKLKLYEIRNALTQIPDEVVNVTNRPEFHLVAMRSSVWMPLRSAAKDVLVILTAETERVESIIWQD